LAAAVAGLHGVAVREVRAGVKTSRKRGGAPAADLEIDYEVELDVFGRTWTFVVEVLALAQPRLVRAMAGRLRDLVGELGSNAGGLVVAPFFSPECRRILRSARLGWLDRAGNVRLACDGLLVEIDRAERDPNALARTRFSLFAPKSASVLRALFGGSAPWRVKELAARSCVSIGQVSNVRRKLLDREWAEVDPGGGIRLVNRRELLVEWRASARPAKVLFRGYTTAHGAQLDERIEFAFGEARRLGGRMLLAGLSAARRTAPFVRSVGEFFYADPIGLELLRSSLDAVPVNSGENLTVFAAPEAGLWLDAEHEANGLLRTGMVQTYLDLWTAGDRGRDAAEHLLRERDPALVQDQG
jgi:hypothetical protein